MDARLAQLDELADSLGWRAARPGPREAAAGVLALQRLLWLLKSL